jgi:signal transduction histidine kinase
MRSRVTYLGWPPLVRARLGFGLRERIWVTVLAAMAVVLLALTAGFNLVLAARLDQEANAVASARASAELDGLRVTAAGIQLTETLDSSGTDTPTWVFQSNRPLEEPRAGTVDQRAAAALTRARGFHDVPGGDTRLYALPVTQGPRRLGTIVSAVGLAPYEQIRQVALVASAVLAALALLSIALGTRWLISRALRPVGEMTRQAAEWSEHDLERRFSQGPPRDEFTTLAATLDGLLERVAASLRHEQMLTAELSHELRTPLTAITTEAQYALRHGPGDPATRHGYEQILQSARQMTRILDTLIAAARAETSSAQSVSDPVAGIQAAIQACSSVAASRQVALALTEPGQRVAVGVDGGLLERVLAPLLENACRHARHEIRVDVARVNGMIEIAVEDDGHGVLAEDEERIFEPGYRAAGAEVNGGPSPGAGLGLALARRLARGVGGDVTLRAGIRGARFIVSLPHG